MAHFSVKQRSPFKKSFCASRRHKRQTASRCLANFFSPFRKPLKLLAQQRPPQKPAATKSDAAALGRAAPVMRNRRDVANHHNVQTGGSQSAHSGFTTGAGALHPHFNRLQAVLIARIAGGAERSLLRGVRSALARTPEADRAG